MAKIVLWADVHFCKRESLVENRYPFLKRSIEWADAIDGDLHFDLGDFFNTSHLSAEDVAVLDSIKFKHSWHCIAGNHEQDGTNSLLHYFRDFHTVYEKPKLVKFDGVGFVLFIPFTKSPIPLDVLLKDLPDGEQALVVSHCEFVGMFGTEEGAGYSVEEINNNPKIKMWFNGHYHQRMKLSEKVVIVGNLCGQNFTQNFNPHGVCIYDTETNTHEFISNPYALVFGKMDTSNQDCVRIRKLIEEDPEKRYVLAIQTDSETKQSIKDWSNKYLVASRIMLSDVGGVANNSKPVEVAEVPTIDHIGLFIKEVTERFGKEIADEIH